MGFLDDEVSKEEEAHHWLLEHNKTREVYLRKSQTSGMTIKDAQSMVDEWIRDVGVRYFSELTNLAMLIEEVGEVARIIARVYGDQSFKKSDGEVKLADELADVLFVLICLANQTDVDLTEAFAENLNKKAVRDRDRHRNNPKLKD